MRRRTALVAALLFVFVLAAAPVATGQGHDHEGDHDHDHMTPEGGMHSGDLRMGQSWDHTFAEEGELDYLCHPHPYMEGRIVVSRDAPPHNATVDVRIKDLAFEPAELLIQPGTTVRWTNEDDVVHTVTEVVAEGDRADTPGFGLALALAAAMAASFLASRTTAGRP